MKLTMERYGPNGTRPFFHDRIWRGEFIKGFLTEMKEEGVDMTRPFIIHFDGNWVHVEQEAE